MSDATAAAYPSGEEGRTTFLTARLAGLLRERDGSWYFCPLPGDRTPWYSAAGLRRLADLLDAGPPAGEVR